MLEIWKREIYTQILRVLVEVFAKNPKTLYKKCCCKFLKISTSEHNVKIEKSFFQLLETLFQTVHWNFYEKHRKYLQNKNGFENFYDKHGKYLQKKTLLKILENFNQISYWFASNIKLVDSRRKFFVLHTKWQQKYCHYVQRNYIANFQKSPSIDWRTNRKFQFWVAKNFNQRNLFLSKIWVLVLV